MMLRIRQGLAIFWILFAASLFCISAFPRSLRFIPITMVGVLVMVGLAALTAVIELRYRYVQGIRRQAD